MIFLGWAGTENPWETEASSTACSEGFDCSDEDENIGQTKRPDGGNENQTVGEVKGIEEGNGKLEIEGPKVVSPHRKMGRQPLSYPQNPTQTLGMWLRL